MTDTLFMDSIIRPNRSLSAAGRRAVVLTLGGFSLGPAVIFLRAGAGPVLAYIGIVLAAVALALTLSARGGQRHERVRVSARHIEVTRQDQGELKVVWESATAFTRVAVIDDAFGHGVLKLQISGREIEIAAELSRPERLDFARHLEKAMRRATAARGG